MTIFTERTGNNYFNKPNYGIPSYINQCKTFLRFFGALAGWLFSKALTKTWTYFEVLHCEDIITFFSPPLLLVPSGNWLD
jgi:hypothetical protein